MPRRRRRGRARNFREAKADMKRERNKSYKTRGAVHIAFGKKRVVSVPFHRSSRQAKRYYVVVSRYHVHISRIKHRPKTRRRRQRRHRKHRRQDGRFY